MKSLLNPLIESASRALFQVDIYGDMFERLAMVRRGTAVVRRLANRRVASDVQAAPLLFIHVPKNGGTSVKHALYSTDPGHVSYRYYAVFCPEVLAARETLAIVRDPVDRLLSGYDFLMNGGGRDVRIQPVPLRRMAHVRTLDDLLDFIEEARGDWLRVDTFLRPQWWYVVDAQGVIGVRHLWALDRARDGFAAFLEGYGIGPLPHKNPTLRRCSTVTDAQRARIRSLYAPDVLLYDRVVACGGHADDLAGTQLIPSNIAATRASIAANAMPSR